LFSLYLLGIQRNSVLAVEVLVFWRFRVGIEFPTIEVRYEHLNIGAEAYVGSGALPSFAKFTFSIIEVTTAANI
jgi:hypothetical protein